MTSINITEESIPQLEGKVALVTGGASGIGLAAVKILLKKGAVVHLLDLNDLDDEDSWRGWKNLHFHRCNVASWSDLRAVFETVGPVHYAFANAGVSEPVNSFDDVLDDSNRLQEPNYAVLDVNLRGPINLTKLAWNSMRKHKVEGSIVITTSATAYAPEHSLPVYSAGKLALVGLIRALRNVIILDNITINAVAPAATITNQLPPDLAAPIIALGLPTSSAHSVGLALVHSATAKQERRVESYGREAESEKWPKQGETDRWNGRILLTLGDTYTEIEEPVADLRPFWFGAENHRLTRLQQAATDFRQVDKQSEEGFETEQLNGERL